MMAATLCCAACAGEFREGVRLAKDGVHFQVREPAATSVAVAGDFNGWSPDAHPMTRAGALWTSVIVLPAGDHVFMYIVDGKSWITPPNAMEIVPDGFGAMNGKVTVR